MVEEIATIDVEADNITNAIAVGERMIDDDDVEWRDGSGSGGAFIVSILREED
jgi:hypothetical protein